MAKTFFIEKAYCIKEKQTLHIFINNENIIPNVHYDMQGLFGSKPLLLDKCVVLF